MPADVDRYVKEMQDKDPSMPDDKAWAIAWSRYCEYKNPNSEHCNQDSYFPGRKQAVKTARDDESYDRFSDASLLDDRYGSGRTQVWYCKAEYFRDLSMGSLFAARKDVLPDPYDLDKTHIYIGNVNETNPSKVFQIMQSEMWSPDGQASTLPAIQKCRHTSMSVGDVMVIGGEILMVDSRGFCDLVTGGPRTASALRVAKKVMDNIKGKLPPPKNFPAAEGLKDKGGGGVHHTRTKDVAKGQSRKEKHKKDPRDKEASSPLSLQRDYGSIDYTGDVEE